MPTAHHTNDSAVFEHRNSMNTTNPIAVDEESPHVQGEEQQQPKSNSTFKRKLGGGLLGVFLLCGCAVGAYFQFRSTSTSTSTAADDSSNVNLHSGQAGEHKTPIHDTLSLDVISTDRVSRHHANMARCDAGFACWKNKWHNKTHVHRQLFETNPKKTKSKWMKTDTRLPKNNYTHDQYHHFSSAAITTVKDADGVPCHDIEFHVMHDLPFGHFDDVNGDKGFRSLRIKVHDRKTGQKAHVIPFGMSFQYTMDHKKYRSPDFYYLSVEPTDAARQSTFVSLSAAKGVTTSGDDLLQEWTDVVEKAVQAYQAANPEFKGKNIGDLAMEEVSHYQKPEAQKAVTDVNVQFNDHGRKLFARTDRELGGYGSGYGTSGSSGYGSSSSGSTGYGSSSSGSTGSSGYGSSSSGSSQSSGYGGSSQSSGYGGSSSSGDASQGTCSNSQSIAASSSWYSCSGCNGCSSCGSTCCCPDGMMAVADSPYCQSCGTTGQSGSGSSMGLGGDTSSSTGGGFCAEIKSLLPSVCTANSGCTQIVCTGPSALASYITFELTGNFDLCNTPMDVSAEAKVDGISVWSTSLPIDGNHYLTIPDTTFGVPMAETMNLFADVDIEGNLNNLQVNTGIEGGGYSFVSGDWKCKDWPTWCFNSLPMWLMKGTFSLSGFCQ